MQIMADEEDEEVTDIRLQIFHNTVREHIIFLLLLILLYTVSYILISRFRRKDRDDVFSNDKDELLAYHISLWLCTFSMAIAVGAALLLPVSIASNEVLLLYPNSYYVKWLNSSLIQGLWNHVFLFSNLSLFVFLPFAYLFTESTGFCGSKKGITARTYETFTVFGLMATIVLGLTYVLCALIDPQKIGFLSFLNLGSVHLPFLYSCVSFLGVLMLLVCTPFGFVRLFGIVGQVIIKPHLLRNAKDEYTAYCMEEANMKRKFNNMDLQNAFLHNSYNNSMSTKTTTTITIRTTTPPPSPSPLPPPILTSTQSYLQRSSRAPLLVSPTDYRLLSTVEVPSMYQKESSYRGYYTNVAQRASLAYLTKRRKADSILIEAQHHKQNGRLKELDFHSKALPKLELSTAFQRNFTYPFAMLLLLFFTGVSVLLVIQNTLELLIGIKALPLSTRQFTLGISSLSKMGPIGAGLEVCLIFYLGTTSVVGFYTMPFISHIRPQRRQTSLCHLILNCAIVLILSSALPLLSRIIGITNFDLLGDFGAIEWLGNFQIVLFYNLVFGTTTALVVANKFTATVRQELCARVASFFFVH